MDDRSKRISSSDFNRLTEDHRPNIIAYAMMLPTAECDRDAKVLLAMSAVWDGRKQYRPSECADFGQWCYQQVAHKLRGGRAPGVTAEKYEEITREAASFLPAVDQRMDAFDKAFFKLLPREKEHLSISCQHHRLQKRYIEKRSNLDRESFQKGVEKLKFKLLASSAWAALHSVGGESPKVTEGDDLLMLRQAAGSHDPVMGTGLSDRIRNSRPMLHAYFQHVSLQQAMETRLNDDPSAELREGVFKKPKKLAVLGLLVLLSIPFMAQVANQGGVVNKQVKRVAYMVIPEPSSVSMVAVGMAILLLRRSRDS